MRKALTLVLLAASTAMSFPAVAQEFDAGGIHAERQAERAAHREARQQERADLPLSAEPRAAREERRRERAERREERQDRSGDRIRDGWQGDPNDPRMEAARRRYERLETQNALRYGTPDQRRQALRDRRQELREDRRNWRQDRREGDAGWRQDRREWLEDRRNFRRDRGEIFRDRRDRRAWNRDWRQDRHYDWRGYRNYNRGLFRAPRYYSPYGYGYGYRRFGTGSILGSLFWGRNYWINDPWQYRLPHAPAGFVWVRYYNDVVLVDRFDGRIVDVIHDFFW